ncbi:sigma-70 family RNA polymerase sigma factor [Labedella populi]|uniref:Sigma-70 family RNA polymerase sigma factor n=1 Tax=Labedella populi TaxID=2498850 RepID=A0A3S4B1Z8_9MICO|nr:sigma-70 family RNA polymerase sigma factor [Labedella populi]RWZ61114.1 sigma-70 family RNA polymerase sigma factor [Labedella populi]
MYSPNVTEAPLPSSVTSRSPDVSDDLVHAHLALAEALAERWSRRANDRLDLRQVAYVGLVQAARRFDCRAGSAFAAFAASYIRGELLHYLRDSTRVVRVPRGVLGAAGPSAGSLASPLSLDAPVVAGGDVMPLSSAVGDFDRRLDESDSRIPLFAALRVLPVDARLIVYLRYFEDLTQAEIARRTGSTQKAVSRSLDGSLRALRRELGRPLPHQAAPGTVRR